MNSTASRQGAAAQAAAAPDAEHPAPGHPAAEPTGLEAAGLEAAGPEPADLEAGVETEAHPDSADGTFEARETTAQEPAATSPLAGGAAAGDLPEVDPGPEPAGPRSPAATLDSPPDVREALDQLRHTLDVQHRDQRHRHAWVLAAAATVVLLLVAVAAAVVVARAGAPTSPDGANPVPTPAASASPIHRLPWPGGPVLVPPGAPTSGPGVDSPGTDATVALDPDGVHLDVFEQLVPGTGDTTVELRPASLTGLGADLQVLRLTVVDLQVELDGRPAVAVPTATGGWRAEGRAPIGRAVLRYRVAGAVLAPSPAPAGRAMAVVTPLGAAASRDADAPVTVRWQDRALLGLSCPADPGGDGAVCGAGADGQWVATVPRGVPALVLGQLDLTARR